MQPISDKEESPIIPAQIDSATPVTRDINAQPMDQIDVIGKIIPLCVDYILTYEMCEDKSLAQIL